MNTCGKVFHAIACALEAASPLLQNMFAELMTPERLAKREAVPVPPATGVDPALAHDAFSKAVEFVYTGTVEWGAGEAGASAEEEEARLVPAVLATAHHLQMESLQDWCLESLARRAAGPEGGRESAVHAALDGPAPHEATLGRCRALADACAAWAAEALAARVAADGDDECGTGSELDEDTHNADPAAAASALPSPWCGALEPAMEAWVCGVARTMAAGR